MMRFKKLGIIVGIILLLGMFVGLYYLISNKQAEVKKEYGEILEIPFSQQVQLESTGECLSGADATFAKNLNNEIKQNKKNKVHTESVGNYSKKNELKSFFLNLDTVMHDNDGSIVFDICVLRNNYDKGPRNSFRKIDTIRYVDEKNVFLIKQTIYNNDDFYIYQSEERPCPIKKDYIIDEIIQTIQFEDDFKIRKNKACLTKDDQKILSDINSKINNNRSNKTDDYIKSLGNKYNPSRIYYLSMRNVTHNNDRSIEFNILEQYYFEPRYNDKIYTVKYYNPNKIIQRRVTVFNGDWEIVDESREEKIIENDEIIKKAISFL